MVNYKIIVVNESVETYATQVFLQMLEFGLNVELDIDYQNTLQSRILNHKNDIVVTIGYLESENKNITVRMPNDNTPQTITLDKFMNIYALVE